jgi:signal peptidase II
MTSTARIRAAFLVCVVCLVGCDHVSKFAAEAALRDRPSVPLVRGVIDLSYTENRDVAFNALSRLSLHLPAWALTAFTVLVTLALLVAWVRRRHVTWPEQAGFVLVSAGAIGNGLDRLLWGHVVDFIHVHHWPVFNVADVLIVMGVALLVLGRQLATSARVVGQVR